MNSGCSKWRASKTAAAPDSQSYAQRRQRNWNRKPLNTCVKSSCDSMAFCVLLNPRNFQTGQYPHVTNLCMHSAAKSAAGELLQDAERSCTRDWDRVEILTQSSESTSCLARHFEEKRVEKINDPSYTMKSMF